jgi:hypothetical protein
VTVDGRTIQCDCGNRCRTTISVMTARRRRRARCSHRMGGPRAYLVVADADGVESHVPIFNQLFIVRECAGIEESAVVMVSATLCLV